MATSTVIRTNKVLPIKSIFYNYRRNKEAQQSSDIAQIYCIFGSWYSQVGTTKLVAKFWAGS